MFSWYISALNPFLLASFISHPLPYPEVLLQMPLISTNPFLNKALYNHLFLFWTVVAFTFYAVLLALSTFFCFFTLFVLTFQVAPLAEATSRTHTPKRWWFIPGWAHALVAGLIHSRGVCGTWLIDISHIDVFLSLKQSIKTYLWWGLKKKECTFFIGMDPI